MDGIIFAGIGVLILLMGYGAIPWASLNVALSAALFAFFRKRAKVGNRSRYAHGAAVFRAVPVGLPDLAGRKGEGHFLAGGAYMDLLLIGCGFVSAIQFNWPEPRHPQRADDSRWASCNTLPTTVFLLGAFVMREPISASKLLVFLFIWVVGLVLLSGTVSSMEEKAPAGNGSRAGEVVRMRELSHSWKKEESSGELVEDTRDAGEVAGNRSCPITRRRRGNIACCLPLLCFTPGFPARRSHVRRR